MRWAWLLLVVGCGARTGLDASAETRDASVDGPDAAVAVPRRTLSMSWDSVCAIGADRKVTCWGNNGLGLLGPDAPLRAPPTRVPGLANAIEIAVGQVVSCALLEDASVWCWGDAIGSRVPIAMKTLPLASRLFAGASTVCVLDAAGHPACVGAPFLVNGACAPSFTHPAFSDAVTETLPDVAEIAIGRQHACALERNGSVSCWGCNQMDVLGAGAQPPTATPVRVVGVAAAHVASETEAVCALGAAGDATCWGDGSQFGTSLTVAPTGPVPVAFSQAFDIDVGVVFTCAASRDQVTCKGSLYDFGTGCAKRAVDTRTFAVPGVREISVGYQDACARDDRGQIHCWGCNFTGATGDATPVGHDTPFTVPL